MRDVLTPAAFDGETLISYGAHTPVGHMLQRVFRQAGRAWNPQIEITLSIAAAPLVAAGLGVALVDGLVPWAQLGELVVRPFRPRSTIDIVLTASTVLPETRFGRAFARDIQAVIHDLGLDRPAEAGPEAFRAR